MAEIPPRLQDLSLRFVLLGSSGEALKKPFEDGWPETANYPYTDTRLSSHRGNIGVCGGFGDLLILDSDDLPRWEELGVLNLIPSTFTIESRPGHRQFYVKCPEHFPSGGLYDPERTDTKGYYIHIGDVKGAGGQAVAPGSRHFSGSTYQIVIDAPIATVSPELVRSIIQKFRDSRKPNHIEQNAARLESMDREARQRRIETDPDRRQRYAEAALKDEVLTLAGTPEGDRNNQLFKSTANMAEFIAAGLLDESDVISELTRAAENTGLGYEEIARTIRSGLDAGKQHPRKIPAREESDILKTLPEMVKADPRSIKDPAVIEALAALCINDPLEYDLVLAETKKNCRDIRLETVRAVVEKHIADRQHATNAPERFSEVSEDITAAAREIINAGGAYEYIHKTWQKRVKGNGCLGKALIVSRGAQSCDNTKGIHVYAHGKHGHGKSEGMEQMLRLCPQEYRMDEDVSPLAIHYASKNGMLLPGTTILIDEMIWSDSLGGIVKRITTRFQQGAGHLTVIDGEPVLVRTQPRLAIWTNSADLQADEQLRDRFLDEPITEGDGYVSDIIEFQKIRDTLPTSSEETARETAICQEIFRDLAGRLFTVKIPFAERINILSTEGTRGYNIFSDLIKGLAALRYAVREKNDQGQLLATEDDFNDAKDIYEGSKGHSEEHYTTAEIRVLQAIIANGYKALYKDIKNETGMSEGRVKDIINGRGKDEQKRHGLRYKCSQLDVNVVDISTVIKGTYSDRVTTHPVELSLPTSFSVADGVRQNLVSLNSDVDRRNHDVDSDVVQNNNSNNTDVVDVVKEKREEDTSKSQSPSVDGSIPSSKQKGQKPTSTTSQSHPMLKSTTSESTSPSVSYVCASCGEDLTGHSSIEKGGKVYCARPGCGYPLREKAEAT